MEKKYKKLREAIAEKVVVTLIDNTTLESPLLNQVADKITNEVLPIVASRCWFKQKVSWRSDDWKCPYNPDTLVGGLSVAPMSAKEMEILLKDTFESGADTMLEKLSVKRIRKNK